MADFSIIHETERPEQPRATLILAVYNQPHYLELVLAGLEAQSFRDFEVIACDDGSTSDIAPILANFASRSGLPLVHVWHEDNGFRKCRIMNRGLRLARGEIVVFLDADCVPYPHFIADHVGEKESGRYLAGRRVELGAEFTKTLNIAAVREGILTPTNPKLLVSMLRGDTRHGNRALVIRNRLVRSLMSLDRVPDVKGCNFSLFRSDLVRVNGFDEVYEGPAYGEDTDLELRLVNAGLKIKSLRGMAVQYHLYHRQQPYAEQNRWRLDDLIATRRILPVEGMYSQEDSHE